jgi:hypothetical protein
MHASLASAPELQEKSLVVVACGQQHAGQFKLFVLVKKIAHVPEFFSLGGQGRVDLVVAVPKSGNGDARQQVHIFLAVNIPQSRAFASDHSHGITAVRTAEQAFFPGFDGSKGL